MNRSLDPSVDVHASHLDPRKAKRHEKESSEVTAVKGIFNTVVNESNNAPFNVDDAIGMLARLQPKRVLLLGDLLLDQYTYGSVNRVSPEAPVPILQIHSERQLPGGAGNVALNLAGLGCSVVVAGRLGDDLAGRQLQALMAEQGIIKGEGLIDVSGLRIQSDFLTPIKNRLIASSQQLLRIDREKPLAMDFATRQAVLSHALAVLDQVDIVVVSDYGKGAIDRELLAPLFAKARELGLAIVVDPKSKDLSLYQGATLIKPNLKEALEASGLAATAELDQVATSIFNRVEALPYLMITRSHEGIALFERSQMQRKSPKSHSNQASVRLDRESENREIDTEAQAASENKQEGAEAPFLRHDFPARAQEVVDVTGAGDCVLAAIVHGMACGLSLAGCSHLANIAGTLAIKKLGCVQLTLKDLSRQMLRIDTHNKVFNDSHLFALKEACRGERVHLLKVQKADLQSMDLLLSLYRYRRDHQQALIILEIPTEDLSEEWIDILIQQESIDLLMLIDSRHPTIQLEAEQVLHWRSGKLLPQLPA